LATQSRGNAAAVLNVAGTVLMRDSFEVHCARRASNWQGAPLSTKWQAIARSTRRGNTGTEPIDNLLAVTCRYSLGTNPRLATSARR